MIVLTLSTQTCSTSEYPGFLANERRNGDTVIIMILYIGMLSMYHCEPLIFWSSITASLENSGLVLLWVSRLDSCLVLLLAIEFGRLLMSILFVIDFDLITMLYMDLLVFWFSYFISWNVTCQWPQSFLGYNALKYLLSVIRQVIAFQLASWPIFCLVIGCKTHLMLFIFCPGTYCIHCDTTCRPDWPVTACSLLTFLVLTCC